jgi:large subunit ribosomal protein L29
MAIGSKELTVEKLDGYDDARLAEELKNAKKELFNLRFQSATGQLEQHGRISAVKKDIEAPEKSKKKSKKDAE